MALTRQTAEDKIAPTSPRFFSERLNAEKEMLDLVNHSGSKAAFKALILKAQFQKVSNLPAILTKAICESAGQLDIDVKDYLRIKSIHKGMTEELLELLNEHFPDDYENGFNAVESILQLNQNTFTLLHKDKTVATLSPLFEKIKNEKIAIDKAPEIIKDFLLPPIGTTNKERLMYHHTLLLRVYCLFEMITTDKEKKYLNAFNNMIIIVEAMQRDNQLTKQVCNLLKSGLYYMREKANGDSYEKSITLAKSQELLPLQGAKEMKDALNYLMMNYKESAEVILRTGKQCVEENMLKSYVFLSPRNELP